MAKHDPAMLAFCDAAKGKFNARLIGLAIQTELGLEAAGQLANHENPKCK